MKTPATDYYKGKNGELRWTESNNIVPLDAMTNYDLWHLVNKDKHTKAYEKEQADAINQYIQFRQTNGYSNEEKYEMKAAFGNEEVIDILTGKTIQ